MEDVSIIVSIYNSEKYLKDMLDCLACQTYPRDSLEIILVNDGSTDSSLGICQEYQSRFSNFKVVSKSNGGISSARNAGLKVASGKYVTFFDSDDTADLDYVQKMVDAIKKTNCELVCCGIKENIDDVINNYGYDEDKTFELEDESSYVDFFNDYWLPVVWNKMYKKELIDVLFDEGISYDEDTVFNLYYLKKVKKITCIKEKLYTYFIRKNSNSLTQQGKNNIFEKSRITNKYRITLSNEVFKSKRAVYVACRKLIKAIFQEVQYNVNNNLKKDEILKIIELRIEDEEVKKSFSYFTKIFDQDIVIKDIIENKDLEKLYDCAVNGFDKYLHKED